MQTDGLIIASGGALFNHFPLHFSIKIYSEEKPASLRMRASLAPQSGHSKGDAQQSFTANMKVHVKMRQADMPAGLSNLLLLASSNMQIQDASKTQEPEQEEETEVYEEENPQDINDKERRKHGHDR